MKVNVGSTDRLIRLVAGVVLVGAGLFAVQGAMQWVLGILGVVLVATGSLRFCPIYAALGLSTNGSARSVSR